MKTLYETSTFTQLGKTVGSALNHPLDGDHEKDEETIDKDDEETKKDVTLTQAISEGGNTLFDAITEACSPSKKDREENSSKKSTKDLDQIPKESILDKVMNCSFIGGNDDDESDEDTFKSRTEEESYPEYGGNEESFESMTDDEEDRRRRRRRHRSKK